MTWTVHLVETLTGNLVSPLPVSSGSWTDAINDAGDLKVKVPTPWLLKQPRWRWGAWSASLLACFQGEPLALGPIVKDPQGGRDFTELEAGDLWSLLDQRVTTDRDYPESEADGGKALAESTLSLNEGSLGTIGRRIVERAQLRPSGWFPISYGSPEELGSNRERNFEGFNLGNNSAGKRLRELTEVINGPDISFRPRWVERGNRVEWVMFHGTEGMPEIAQDHTYTVDLTAPSARAVAPKVSSEFVPYARVYASGDGQDKGTLIRITDEPVAEHMPLLETVLADSQTSNPDLLTSRGRGLLQQGRTVQLSVSVDDPLMPLHTWWAGDEVTVIWPHGWPQLDGGTYRMRILKRSGDFSGRRVNVEFQPEQVLA